ncbi:hypothetical protein QBC32DRAFT_343876 [Pseudoneurospora amorphoporcata]|uniref:Uncharacterized protein n=1 Tax=Pseudoneurospora amorphoporcata TaxID=241081 RepID=A0AAN6NWP0_9PEZI|nr:hypothetical protein QBC32DRAFT_343876 [Pseudoneurospora amorphoporcata]
MLIQCGERWCLSMELALFQCAFALCSVPVHRFYWDRILWASGPAALGVDRNGCSAYGGLGAGGPQQTTGIRQTTGKSSALTYKIISLV